MQEPITALSQFYSSTGPTLHTSKEGIGRVTGVDPQKIEPYLGLISNCMYHMEASTRLEVEAAVASSRCKLICYLDLMKYDETPMRVTIKQSASMLQASMPDAQQQAGRPGLPDIGLGSTTVKTTSTSKLLQCIPKYAMLVQLPAMQGEDAADPYVLLFGTSLSWIQVIDRGTGQCIKQALSGFTAEPVSSSNFKTKVRVVTTDQHPSNFLCERLIQEERGRQWQTVHLSCNVHCVSRVFSRTLEFLNHDIGGLLNMTLFLSIGSNMSNFRRSVQAILMKKLTFLRGHPPAHAQERRQQYVDMFCSTGPRVEVRRQLLDLFANGDWNRQDRFEIWILPGVEINEDVLRPTIITALLVALTGRTYRNYPRHRWLGCDVAVDEIALMQSCHGLASAAFKDMCGSLPAAPHHQEQGTWRGAQPQSPGLQHDEEPTAEVTRSNYEESLGAQQPLLGASSAALGMAEEPQLHEGTERTSPGEFNELNHRRGRTALQWLCSDPLPRLLLLRKLLQPLCSLMSTYITRSGVQWELEQRCQQAAPATDPVSPGGRALGLLCFVQQDAEQEFQHQLSTLREPHCWRIVPSRCLHVAFQTECFQALSKMGCLPEELLVQPSKQWPLKLFKTIAEPHLYPSFEDECVRTQDDFTVDFFHKYPPKQGLVPEARAVLLSVAHMASVDIVDVEWLHGRAHRLLQSQQVQTQLPTIGFLNSQLLLQKFKLRRAGSCALMTLRRRMQTTWRLKHSSKRVLKKRKRRGGGGAWRTWTSHRVRGQAGAADWSALAAEYRAAKEARTEEYRAAEAAGAAAAQKHQVNPGPTFGPKTRDLRQKAAKIAAAGTQPVSGPLGMIAGSSMQISDTGSAQLQLGPDLQHQLSVVRSTAMFKARRKVDEKREEVSKLLSSLSARGPQEQEAVLKREPSLLPAFGSACFVPDRQLLKFEFLPDHTEQAANAVSWCVEHQRTSNLSKHLLQNWEQQAGQVVKEPHQADPVHEQPLPLCRRYGTCLCSPQGKILWSQRNAFLAALKTTFPRQSALRRDVLLPGLVVCELSWEEESTVAASSWSGSLTALMQEDSAEEEGWQRRDSPLWLHLGLMYLKPFRPTFQELLCSQGSRPGCQEVTQTGKFMTLLHVFKGLPQHRPVRVRFHRLLVSPAPVATLQPKQAWITALGSEPMTMWEPTRRRARGQGRGRGRRRGSSRSERQPTQQHADQGEGPHPDLAQESDDVADAQGVSDEAEETDDSDGQSLLDPMQAENVEELLQLVADQGTEAAGRDTEAGFAGEETGFCQEEEGTLQEVPEQWESDAELIAPEAPANDAEAILNDPFFQDLLVIASSPSGAASETGEAEAVASEATSGRVPAEITVDLAHGRITFYRQGFFTATCYAAGHQRCVLTRTALAGRRRSQGRPLGLLAAWLTMGPDVPNKEAHWDRSVWPSQAERWAQREVLATVPGGQDLLDQERPQEPGEEIEPDDLP